MRACDRGFTVLETLVALLLTLVVTMAGLALLNPHHLMAQVQDEAMDATQRVRVAMEAITRDLAMAGAGPYAGPRRGGLVQWFAPALPRRVGLTGADSPWTARADAITVAYVPVTYAQTTTAGATAGASGLTVNPAPNCPVGSSACGFRAGMTVVVFDDSGAHDMFRVTAVLGGTAQVQAHASSLSHVYPAGSTVAQAESRTYYLDPTNNQLRRYDGYQGDAPVADNVVGLSFEYLGDGLLPLPLSMLSDGPWKGSGATQFDADLVGVRAIRISVRVQASLAAFRATGPAFVRPGTSRSSAHALPDVTVTTVVAPVNLRRDS